MASVSTSLASIGDMPTSTMVTGALAICLALTLFLFTSSRRNLATLSVSEEPQQTDDQPSNSPSADRWRRLVIYYFRYATRQCPVWTKANGDDASKETSQESMEGDLREPSPPPVRDTPGAIAALELAEAYIEEVREAERPAFDDKTMRRDQLNTLALAAKQLALAEELDPDAELIVSIEETDVAFTIDALKAKALILEARSYDDHDTKRALPPLRQAIEVDPTNATAHYLLGMIEAANMNRARAIEALQAAIQLEPDNLTFRKELNRAESISGAEAAAFKATRMGERTYDTGIAAWNVFAVTWNVVTFPFRTISALMRIFRVG